MEACSRHIVSEKKEIKKKEIKKKRKKRRKILTLYILGSQ